MNYTNDIHSVVNKYKIKLNEHVSNIFAPNRIGFGRQSVRVYIENITYVVKHTTHFMKNAKVWAQANSDELLYNFFDQIDSEEIGHEKWGYRDVNKLANKAIAITDYKILPTMHKICAYLDEMTKTRPMSFISYAYLAESITVYYGDTIVSLLEKNYDIPANALSIIANHVKTDARHIEEELERLRELEAIGIYDFEQALADTLILAQMICEFYNEVELLQEDLFILPEIKVQNETINN